jgi:hypothetical protein
MYLGFMLVRFIRARYIPDEFDIVFVLIGSCHIIGGAFLISQLLN